jgi:hypothetical protein
VPVTKALGSNADVADEVIEWRPVQSIAPYVTLDNRLNVLPPLDPSAGSFAEGA